MTDETDIETLLRVFELIVMEREEALQMMDESDFRDGHVNGLNEALNRVVEQINYECYVKNGDDIPRQHE